MTQPTHQPTHQPTLSHTTPIPTITMTYVSSVTSDGVFYLGGPGVRQVYFIGDPKHALSDANYDLLQAVHPVNHVEIAGRVLVYGNAFKTNGIYVYYDSSIYRYHIVSGNIGLIPWDLCTKLHRVPSYDIPGHVVSMDGKITFKCHDGKFSIVGDNETIHINTRYREDILSNMSREQMKDLLDAMQEYIFYEAQYNLGKYGVYYDPTLYAYYYDEDTGDEEEIQIDHMNDSEMAERIRAKTMYIRYLESQLDKAMIIMPRFDMSWIESQP